jgi:serine/threonine kinase 32
MRQGYRGEVDWWSMGVVLYELLFAKRPFRGRSSKDVASKIVKSQLQFPARELSDECFDFIAKVKSRSM